MYCPQASQKNTPQYRFIPRKLLLCLVMTEKMLSGMLSCNTNKQINEREHYSLVVEYKIQECWLEISNLSSKQFRDCIYV